MILSITGHRPNKLNSEYDYDGPYTEFISSEIDRILDKYKPEICISGMAIGVDTIFALCALSKGINLHAAIPFEGQECRWNDSAQKLYNNILNHPLTTKYYLFDPGYERWKMQKRNEWMVDKCDILITVWDGTPGGTANCVASAKKVKKRIHEIDIKSFKHKFKNE